MDVGPRGRTPALQRENKRLRVALGALDARLDEFETKRQALSYAPADMRRARLRSLRARKEIAGGMHGAAALDLVRLEALIVAIDAQIKARARIPTREALTDPGGGAPAQVRADARRERASCCDVDLTVPSAVARAENSQGKDL